LVRLDDVERARKGDKEAFVRLMRTLEVSLFNTAKAFLRTDADCADALQETVLKAYRSIRNLKEPAYFKTWVVRILINECKRMLHAKRNVIALETGYDPSADDPAFASLELRELVEQLETPLRSVVLLYYYGDLSVKEIAQELELPEGTVKSRLYRARELLSMGQAKETKGADGP